MFRPRPKQQEVLNYRSGRMGVSAVPGSGKTSTLSYLAARLVATADLADDQEVLVVTLVKSAVGNFAQTMSRYLKDEFNLLPGFGYRVCTLHSLANDIVRERPGLAGLDDKFNVFDEHESDTLVQDAVETWVRTHPGAADGYLTEEQFDDAFTRTSRWPDAVKGMAYNFIKQAKDTQLTAGQVQQRLKRSRTPLPLAEICGDIYDLYEQGLASKGAVDFQDLIRLALKVLQQDRHFLDRLRRRWPYILEDEAQDSSQLQEQILRLLAGRNGNWVRVGDPNQAIYETFTTANPKFLRDFLNENGVQKAELPNSGRSTQSIIDLANALIDWSLDHPHHEVRERRPLDLPYIEPTPSGDPQGNPPDNPEAVQLRGEKFTSEDEREAIVKSLKQWLPQNQDKTVAVLLPINASGANLVQALRKAGIDYVENLHSTTGTRAVVGSLARALDYLTDPKNSAALADSYRVWRRDERGDEEAERSIESIVKELKAVTNIEDYLWPRTRDWLDEMGLPGDNAALYEHLIEFRTRARRWQLAADLPVDQLVLTLAGDLFTLETEIATAYSVALHLRHQADLHPEWRLPDYTRELYDIAAGKKKFSGVGDEDLFDPDRHKGKVTVTTMHKAKGLEWDRVYLMSVSNYDYPSADPYDTYIGERWFIRSQLNLDAEALAQLSALAAGENYIEGEATQAARIEYAAERLRLLYVGITRARSELVITWNSGRRGEQVEARPLAALRGWWEQELERRV